MLISRNLWISAASLEAWRRGLGTKRTKSIHACLWANDKLLAKEALNSFNVKAVENLNLRPDATSPSILADLQLNVPHEFLVVMLIITMILL